MSLLPPYNNINKEGHDGATLLNLRGDSYKKKSFQVESQRLSVLKNKDVAEDSQDLHLFPVATECACHRRVTNFKVGRETRLSERLGFKEKIESSNEEDEKFNDGDDSLSLKSLLETFQKFSTRILTPLQVQSLVRLAGSHRTKEAVTKDHCKLVQMLLASSNQPIQVATLMVLATMASEACTVEFLLVEYTELLDCLLSLASDPPDNEVQISALKVIVQITQHTHLMSLWEKPLEDIVYSLLHSLIKSKDSAETLKLTCLRVMRNLSKLQDYAMRVKQDIFSLLSLTQENVTMKEIYLDILQGILQKFKTKISKDVLDTLLLPVLTSMLIQGPCKVQCQSLMLLTCLAEDEISRAAILYSPQTVALCTHCNRNSMCRRVTVFSCSLLQQMLNVKTISDAKQFMSCVADSITMAQGKERGNMRRKDGKVGSSFRKNCMDCEQWQNLDDLIDWLLLLLEKQGCLQRAADSNRLTCDLNIIGDINNDQLTCLSAVVGCLNNLCSWPLSRPKSTRDYNHVCEDFFTEENFRSQVQGLRHHHGVYLWEKSGPQVMALFRQMAHRMAVNSSKYTKTNIANNPTIKGEKTNSTSLPGISQQEMELLRQLLNYLTLMSVISCSFKKTPATEKFLDSSEETKQSSKKRLKEEIAEKQIFAEKRILRRSLVEEGIFYLVGQVMPLNDVHLKIMGTTILRLCLQPTDGKVEPVAQMNAVKDRQRSHSTAMPSRPSSAKPEAQRKYSMDQRQLRLKQRPQSSNPASSKHSHNTELKSAPAKIKSVEFSRQTTPTSYQECTNYTWFFPLTPRTSKKPLFHRTTPPLGPVRPKSSNVSWLLADDVSNKAEQTETKTLNALKNPVISNTRDLLMSPLNPGNNIVANSCPRVLLAAAGDILRGIFSTDKQLKRSSLLLLHDLVLHGKNELHMELSKLGCVPKLVDFLRINDDDQLMEITGLTIARILLSSDRRICQLFNFHGGSVMLMALLHDKPSDELKQAVMSTLNTLNYMVHTDPARDTVRQPADIWDHIMERWEGEDKVVDVLKQFL